MNFSDPTHPLPRRSRSWRPLAGLLALALAVLVGGCEEEKAPPEPLRPVKTTLVRDAPPETTRIFGGVSQAGSRTELSFRVAGRIERLPVDAGDQLEKGALVAQLDPSDLQIEASKASAALSQAQAQIRQAEAEFERVRELWEADVASLADLDAARAAFESAQAQVASASQQLALANKQVSYTTLTAPAKGKVAEVYAEENETVEAGTPIAMFYSGRLPEVAVTIPESFIGEIRVGQDASVAFDAIPDQSYPARVSEVGSVGEQATTFPVTLRLETSPAQVRAGLAADVTFALPRDEKVKGVIVPPNAIGQDDRGRFAMVVQVLNWYIRRALVARRKVEVGPLHSSGLEVTSGLKPGQRIVTAGLSGLEDGERVRFPPQSGAGADDSPEDDAGQPEPADDADAPGQPRKGDASKQ